MRTIVENNMKEYRVFGVVYDLEDLHELELDIDLEEEDIDEFGTIIYECHDDIFATSIVDIMRELLLLGQYYEVAESFSDKELDSYVDNNYDELYWKFQ